MSSKLTSFFLKVSAEKEVEQIEECTRQQDINKRAIAKTLRGIVEEAVSDDGRLVRKGEESMLLGLMPFFEL